VAFLSVAIFLLSGTLALASVKSGSYIGSTSEGGTVTLTISRGGRAVTHFHAEIGYNGKCGQGGGPGLTAAPSSIPIGRRGSFNEPVRLILRAGSLSINDPGRVLGKVSGSTITGTIEQYLKGKVNKCYVESFTAVRA
jgi:hypothetical protein